MLGQILKNLRIARGLSREELVRGHYSVSHLAGVEQGSKRPSVRMLDYLARRLMYPLEKLVPQVFAEGFPAPELLRLARKICRDGQYEIALDVARRVNGLEGVHETYRADILTTEAYIEFARGNYQKSAGIYRAVCRVRERGGNAVLISRAYRDVGLVEECMGNHDRALHWLFMAWERLGSERSQNPELSRNLLRAYANNLFYFCHYDQALSMYERLRSLCEAAHVTDRLFAHWGIGSCAEKLGDFARAEHHHTRAAALAEEMEGGEPYLGEIYINLGVALRKGGRHERACSILAQSYSHNLEYRPSLVLHSINETLQCLLEMEEVCTDEIARWLEAAVPSVIDDASEEQRAVHQLLLARISGLNGNHEEACARARQAFAAAAPAQIDIRTGALAELLHNASTSGDCDTMDWVASRLREMSSSGKVYVIEEATRARVGRCPDAGGSGSDGDGCAPGGMRGCWVHASAQSTSLGR